MAINAINGITASTATVINGISGVDEVNGLELSGGGGPTLVKYEDFEASGAEYVALNTLTGWTDKIAGIYVYWAGTVGGVPKVAFPANAANSLTYYSAGTPSENQTVEGTLTAVSTGSGIYIGPATRVQAGSNDCYYILTDGDYIALNKRIGGTEDNILTPSTGYGLVIGNKIRLVTTGSGSATRLTVQKNTSGSWVNVSGLVSVDPGAYLGSGYGGIAGYGNGTSTTMDDWYWYND